MKFIILILTLFYIPVNAQVAYQDIGNTRLIDSSGRFYIIAKPGTNSTTGSINFKKNLNSQKINVTGDYYKAGVPIVATPTDTSLLMHKYDSLRFALRWKVWDYSNLDTANFFSVYRLDTAKLFYERDTTKLGGLDRNNTWNLSNTFVGLITSGFIQMGSTGYYEKTATKKVKITAVSTVISVAHGIPNFKNILSLSVTIFHDTVVGAERKVYPSGYNTGAFNVPSIVYADTTNFYAFMPATGTAFIDDSLCFRAVYSNKY